MMNPHARFRRTIAPILVFLGACAADTVNGPGAITGALISASVQVPAAAAGEAVPVRFSNGAEHLYSFNTCLRRVERREGTTWVLLPEEFRLCTEQLDFVPALAERTFSADVPLDATPGEYRFRFSVAPPTGPAVAITTPAFRVE